MDEINQIRRLLDSLEKRLTQSQQEQDKGPELSLEAIYRHYPRKIGKQRGMQRLKKLNTEQLQQLLRAVLNYRNYAISEALEPRYIKHFSTFASEWEDWAEPPTTINTHQEKQKRIREKRAAVIPDDSITPEEREAGKEKLQEIVLGLVDKFAID